MLILEQDDTLIASDRKLLYRATRDAGCPDLRYEHQRAAAELLLALPDAIARCWAKAATGDDASNPSSRTSAKSERARTSAKPERHGRPAGPRAHFPQLLPRTAQVQSTGSRVVACRAKGTRFPPLLREPPF